MLALPYSSTAFELTRLVDRASAPLELDGTTARLFLRQIIEVVDGHCQVESYSYRLQTDESIESWLIRWEYYRAAPRPDYPYPLAHVHSTRPSLAEALWAGFTSRRAVSHSSS